MGTAKGDGYTITPRDLELVVHAIKCTRLPFELEYDRLSRRLGYKNAQSAKAAWNALKRKLDKVAEGAPVVPSLTIDPEPLRLSAGPASKAESSSRGNKKGEQPVVERSQESSEEDTKSESEEPQPSRNRSRKKRELTRIVDGDGDVSMGEGPDRTANAPHIPKAAHKSTLKATVPVGGKKKHLRTSAPSSTPSDSSDTDVPTEPKIPRKKLKTNLKQLSVEEPAKDEKKREAKGKRKEKLVAQPETEAFIAREKAFGGRDEDEEDDDEPPPAYVKWESESCGEGVQ